MLAHSLYRCWLVRAWGFAEGKEYAPLPAGARIDHGGWAVVTGNIETERVAGVVTSGPIGLHSMRWRMRIHRPKTARNHRPIQPWDARN